MANVTVISATVPLLAAGLAWLILRKRVRRSTVMAAAVAIASVTLTVAGNLGPGDFDGNLRAVVLAFLLALLIVLLRRFEGADAVLALCSAGVLVFVVALVVADPLSGRRPVPAHCVLQARVRVPSPWPSSSQRALQPSNYNRPRRCHRPLQATSFPRRPWVLGPVVFRRYSWRRFEGCVRFGRSGAALVLHVCTKEPAQAKRGARPPLWRAQVGRCGRVNASERRG